MIYLLFPILIAGGQAAADESNKTGELLTSIQKLEGLVAGSPVEIANARFRWVDLEAFQNDLLQAMAMDPTRSPESKNELAKIASDSNRSTKVLRESLARLDDTASLLGGEIQEEWRSYQATVESILGLREQLRFKIARRVAQQQRLISRFEAVIQARVQIASPRLEIRYKVPVEWEKELRPALEELRRTLASVDLRNRSLAATPESPPSTSFSPWPWVAGALVAAASFFFGRSRTPRLNRAPSVQASTDASEKDKPLETALAPTDREPFDYSAWLGRYDEMLMQWLQHKRVRSELAEAFESHDPLYGQLFAGLCLASNQQPSLTASLSEIHRIRQLKESDYSGIKLSMQQTDTDYEHLLSHLLRLCDAIEGRQLATMQMNDFTTKGARRAA